jgi:hypothetical protein
MLYVMEWKTLGRSVAVVMVPVGILAGSIAICLGGVYCASILDVPADRIKPWFVTTFFLAMMLLAKVGSWILWRSLELSAARVSTPADTRQHRIWRFGEKTRHWLETLISTLLALACVIVVAAAADRRGLSTWAIVLLIVPAWIFGVVVAARVMTRLDRAIARFRPPNEADTRLGV